MTNEAWESLSNQALAAAGILYFLSLLAYLVQWSSLRKVPIGRKAAVAVGAGGPEVAEPEVPVDGAASRRADMTGRLGLILAGLACALHLLSLLGRGLAADPNRVPWGNMYEFTLAGTFVVALIFLVAPPQARPRLGRPAGRRDRVDPADGRRDLALRAGRSVDRGAQLPTGWSSMSYPRSSRPARSRWAGCAPCSTW